MSVTTRTLPAEPTEAEPVAPFGMPPGTVRGLLSILICAFFWIVLLLPPEHQGKVVLAHFFLLGLVVMAFASHPVAEGESSPFLPWLLRLIFVGASVAVVVFAWARDANLLQARLTPDLEEIKMWWIPFMACMAGGFAFGLFLRFLLGKRNHVFRTVRAWFSVVGSVMLALEIAIFLAATGGQDPRGMDFLHYWQCVSIVVVSAYFGTRA